MQQEDFILKEIEKIGKVILAIRNKIVGGTINLETITPGKLEQTNDMLLDELDFELASFLDLSENEAIDYISKYPGFNVENMELLAGLLTDIGFNTNSVDKSGKYLGKALILLQFCNMTDKTFKVGREYQIGTIKQKLIEYQPE